MSNRIRSHLTYANVMATVAVFLALGGGVAWALANNSVKSKHIVNGQVKPPDLQPPEAWHEIAAASTTADACSDPSATEVFCTHIGPTGGKTPWSNYLGGFGTAAFYKDELGIVRLRGLVQRSGTLTSETPFTTGIFRLPAAYAPASRRAFSSVGSDGSFEGLEVVAGRVDVMADGMVSFVQDCDADNCSANSYLTLDGISFRPDE